jgi:hypothetical protein
MVAYLAVILSRLKHDIAASPIARRLRNDLNNFLMSKSNSNSAQPSSSNRSQSMGDASDQSSNKPCGDSREGQHAADVASCEGEVNDLRGCACLAHYREGSPLYFVGAIASSKVPVFIKVWRAAAGRRSQQRCVETEVRLLKMAHQRGVPCPDVVDQLTKVNVISEHGQYHRLVMHKLPNHAVRDEDLLHFAVSLIEAVLKLHEAGILHCVSSQTTYSGTLSLRRPTWLTSGTRRRKSEPRPTSARLGSRRPKSCARPRPTAD